MRQLSEAPGRAMRVKLFAVVLVAFIAFTFYISFNLFETSVIKSEYYREKANSQQLDSFTINANRGTVYDKNGKVLAKSATVWNVVLSPYDIDQVKDDIPAICQMLTDVLGLDYNKLKQICEDPGNRYEIVKKKINKEQHDEILRIMSEKEIGYYSVSLQEDSMRTYPNDSLASNLIGFTDYENDGIYGVEASYDEYLQGRDGRLVILKDGNGKTMGSEYEERYDAVDGGDVYMTIDSVLQHYLEKNLETAVAQYHAANRATGIMMDPNTGAILAMATTPGFNLNSPSKLPEADLKHLAELRKQLMAEAVTDEELKKVDEKVDAEEALLRGIKWRNKAITELYFPGSVFKVVTCASALEEKVVDLHSSFYCPGVVKVADTKIGCWNRAGHGTLNLLQAVTKSCNPSFIEISGRLGKEKFYDYFEAFGFTEPTGIDLPAEAFPLTMPRNKMGPVELATSSFGQTNKITPLQMITAYAACINGGYLVTPHIVDKITDNEGNVIKTNETKVKRQVLSEETSATMRYILEEVVKTNGGSNAYISGYRIGGKSGTSQKIDEYSYENMRYVGSFCGFAPAESPKVIMLVIVDEPNPGGEPYYGSTVASPVVSAVFRECFANLEIYPQYTAEEQAAMDSVMPYIIGMTPDSAVAALNAKGLSANFVGTGGKVLKTIPDTGQIISRGGTVVVYLEQQDYTNAVVPNVYGKSVSEANRLIADAGLNIRLTGGAVNNAGAKAVWMSAEPGSEVIEGTVIEVKFAVDDGFGG